MNLKPELESTQKILRKGILASLFMSALIGEAIVFGWFIFSQLQIRKKNEEWIRNVFVETFSKKGLNFEQKKSELGKVLNHFPIDCAKLKVPNQDYIFINRSERCDQPENLIHPWSMINFGDSILLYYILSPTPLSQSETLKWLFLVFCVVFGCLILSWSLLAQLLKNTVLVPLEKLTHALLKNDKKFFSDFKSECREIHLLATATADFYQQIEESARFEAAADLSRQVAHDIRSPLSILQTLVKSHSDPSSEDKILIDKAIVRIQEIADQLLVKGVEKDRPHQDIAKKLYPEPIAALVETVISEKRIEFSKHGLVQINFTVEGEYYSTSSKVNRNQFKSLLSNILNNALESMADLGVIEVALKVSSTGLSLSVKDNGLGIPPSILPQLMRKGFTYKKTGGHGLGLYFAREWIQSWGGSISIDSEENQGTQVVIQLPVCETASWYLQEVRLERHQQVGYTGLPSKGWEGFRKRCDRLRIQAVEVSLDAAVAIHLVHYDYLRGQGLGFEAVSRLIPKERVAIVVSDYENPKTRLLAGYYGIRLVPEILFQYLPIQILEP